MSTKCKVTKISRGHVRTRVTKLVDDIGTNVSSFSKTKITQSITSLKEFTSKLELMNDIILTELWDEKKSDIDNTATQEAELENIAAYEDKITGAMAALEQALEVVNSVPTQTRGNQSHTTSTVVPRVKAEKVPLPTYSGEKEESFEKFVSTFEALVDAKNYTDYEKFLLLKKNVHGRAAMLLNSLELAKRHM